MGVRLAQIPQSPGFPAGTGRSWIPTRAGETGGLQIPGDNAVTYANVGMKVIRARIGHDHDQPRELAVRISLMIAPVTMRARVRQQPGPIGKVRAEPPADHRDADGGLVADGELAVAGGNGAVALELIDAASRRHNAAGTGRDER